MYEMINAKEKTENFERIFGVKLVDCCLIDNMFSLSEFYKKTGISNNIPSPQRKEEVRKKYGEEALKALLDIIYLR